MPKCCVCDKQVYKLKAPGVQCSGACQLFYHFEKCSNLTNNEIESIERKRLTYQCKKCKSKRASLVFSRNESVSDTENEHLIDKVQYEQLISNQQVIMASLSALNNLIETCTNRINCNSSKIEQFLNNSGKISEIVTPEVITAAENVDMIQQNPLQQNNINEIETMGEESNESDFEDAVTVVTQAQVHRNDSGDTDMANPIPRTKHHSKKTRKKPIHRVKKSRLIVKPTGSQTSDKTKTDLRAKVQCSVPISGVRNASNGGIIITCDSSDQIRALHREASDNLGTDYEVRLLEKHNPKILIVGMSTLIDKTALTEKLKDQNSFLRNSTISVIKVQQSTKSKYFNAVVELDNQSYKQAIHLKKLFINWERCFVYDNVYVVQCYKCCGYNHKTDICKNDQSCSKCAQPHLFKDCTSSFTMCINCKTSNEKYKMNLDVNHPSWDKKCSVHLRKIQLEKRKINYCD